MKIVGIIPARMAASRFHGKPLFPICGRPMIEHVFRRAALFPKWDGLYLATCDEEIASFGRVNNLPAIMTAATHTRALDRVAEAAGTCGQALAGSDIVVCVQGDEPMLHPDMIGATVAPLLEEETASCTVLAMEIVDEQIFLNPDTVKIVHDLKGRVLYTSRSPVPYFKKFPAGGRPSHGRPAPIPRRIYGIFAFRWHFLQTFTATPESPLEVAESCDSNRICDNGLGQVIAPYPYRPSFSVDSPADAARVEAHMKEDPLWGQY
jgi:3-deoxy-manno-octulosonate cytidylyltransferase (CMP-KDO synthetase)